MAASFSPFMAPFMEPIHILGSGSIGLLWASSLRSAFPSYPLAVLFRPHHRSRLLGGRTKDVGSKRSEVIVCTMRNRRPRLASIPVEFIGEDPKGRAPIRNLILATKAYQATDAVESILSRLRSLVPSHKDKNHLRIFVLSNGALDVRENLQTLLQSHEDIPTPDWIMCTTTHGVVKEDDDESFLEQDDDEDDDNMEHMIHLNHIGNGRTFLGGHPAMTRLWDQCGLNASLIGDSSSEKNLMEVLLWKKLAGNCFCNPLTALWGVTNGQLMKHEQGPRIRKQVVSEVSNVARAFNPTWRQEDTSEKAMDAFVEQVIQDNIDNRSSMYRDVKRGRRTEVDSLNGYIVRKGKELGIATPANEELLLAIEEITVHSS